MHEYNENKLEEYLYSKGVTYDDIIEGVSMIKERISEEKEQDDEEY